MAGREGWKTATAGRAEKPEQKRERAREKRTHTHTHSHGGRDRKAPDRSSHYGWEACWELGRLASDPQDADTALDRKPEESGYCFAWSSADLRTETHTAPPPLRTLIWVCRIYSHPHTHTGGTKSSSRRVEVDIQGGTGRRDTPSNAAVYSRTHTYTHRGNG